MQRLCFGKGFMKSSKPYQQLQNIKCPYLVRLLCQCSERDFIIEKSNAPPACLARRGEGVDSTLRPYLISVAIDTVYSFASNRDACKASRQREL